MEYPKRKSIRLKNYDYGQNDAFFVTICTQGRAGLFGEIEENGVGAALRGRPFRLLHFTGRHTGRPLPDMVGWFKTMTTNAYIRGVKAGIYPRFKKKVWQRGYYEHIIRNDEDLYEAQKYIMDNPAKWYENKLFKKSVYRE